MNEYDSEIQFRWFELPTVYEPLLFNTDLGLNFIGQLPYSDWRYEPNMVEWDGTKITFPTHEEGGNITYKIYSIDYVPGNTERLEAVYNLDYYTELPIDINEYEPGLNGNVGILIKMKNSAVVSYTILNTDIENYSFLEVYNLSGKEIMRVEKGLLSKMLLIPGTTQMEMTEGHYISFNLENMQSLEIETPGHYYTRIVAGPLVEEVDYVQDKTEVLLDGGINSIRLEVYGTENIKLKLLYTMKIK